MKLLPCIFILLFQFSFHTQYQEHIFEIVTIEIDGETIFDVSEITQDHQGYLWLETNMGLIRYDGIEGKKYSSAGKDVFSHYQ